jgi:phage transcriptional activator, RinA family
MKENNFKKTEKTLYDYINIDIKIDNIELQINRLLNDVSCAGVSYEYKGGPSNSFNSNVENEVIKRDEHLMDYIESLRKTKENTILLKQSIDNALRSLDDEEYKLIELRYFDRKRIKKTWLEIGMKLGIDKDNCCKMKNEIINRLADLIYPKPPSFDQF